MIFALVENRRRTHNMLCLYGFNARKAARRTIVRRAAQMLRLIKLLAEISVE